ncbi:hypothetical protein BOX15_Mlig021245g1 [Macrostomum lignano]|uniref:Uncharacterized protein n=1 Tax=Macrostomum lignano TaxID=282301 RepID=A0A267FUY0_9PLAT|nr:hypothetical protein BOX15_Mlig021245g1 [Macrostomum lignano]
MAGAGNSFDSDDGGEWHTVWKGGKKKRQPESETVENWARGQEVRDRDRQFEDGRDSSRGNSERGSSRGGGRVGARVGWANRDSDNGSSRDDYRSSGGRGGRGRWANRDGDSGNARDDSRSGGDRGGRGGWANRDGDNGSSRDDSRSGGGRGGRGGWANRDGDNGSSRDDSRSGGGRGVRGGWANRDGDNGSSRDDYRSSGGRGGRGSWFNVEGENRNARTDFRSSRGSVEYRGRYDSRGRGRGRGDGRTSAPRDSRKNQNWNFSTLMCGPADSQIVFTEYQGFCNQRAKELRDRGHIHVALFRTTTDEEVCQNFREKLRSITTSMTECKDLLNENCQLRAFIRVGDLYFRHSSFRFDSRPGPQLRDFGDLMESDKFEEASQRLDRFFDPDKEVSCRRHLITSTFVTEKTVANHALLEVFLSMRDFEEVSDREKDVILTLTLNGEQRKFELTYDANNLVLDSVMLITSKWNLNIVTAKGTDYQGSFNEVADFRLQFEASFPSDTEEVNESLAAEGFKKEDLQQLFERIGEAPTASDLLSDGSERHYRLKSLPHLAEKLDYVREQINRTFVRDHDRWPLQVRLRQFKFYKLVNPVAGVFQPLPGVELRVSADLGCSLDPEVLGDPEFVSYMWECCQLMQDLVAASLEA